MDLILLLFLNTQQPKEVTPLPVPSTAECKKCKPLESGKPLPPPPEVPSPKILDLFDK